MKPHKVISAFRASGRLIEPGSGPFTPANQAQADRLIGAKCLRTPKPGEADRKIPTLEEAMASGYGEAEAHGIIAREQALADGKRGDVAQEIGKAAFLANGGSLDDPKPDDPKLDYPKPDGPKPDGLRAEPKSKKGRRGK